MNTRGYDASTLLPSYKGVGILRPDGETDAGADMVALTVRTYYMPNQDWREIYARGRALRLIRLVKVTDADFSGTRSTAHSRARRRARSGWPHRFRGDLDMAVRFAAAKRTAFGGQALGCSGGPISTRSPLSISSPTARGSR